LIFLRELLIWLIKAVGLAPSALRSGEKETVDIKSRDGSAELFVVTKKMGVLSRRPLKSIPRFV
jgi:hypothetical protein